jgi:hypothetical protein
MLVAAPLAAEPWERWTARPPCPALETCPDILLSTFTQHGMTRFAITYTNPANLSSWWTRVWYATPTVDVNAVFRGSGWTWSGKVYRLPWTIDGSAPDVYINGIRPADDQPWYNTFEISSGGPTLYGCAIPMAPGSIWDPGGIAICPEQGYDGSISLYYDMTGRFTLADLANPTETGPEWFCDTAQCASETVTPEPSTWALMLTGLVGIGVFARRRRV